MKELEFLRELCCSKQAQSDYAAAIIETLADANVNADADANVNADADVDVNVNENSVAERLSPLRQYAIINSFKKACEEALTSISASALVYAKDNHLGDDGKEFVQDELVFLRKTTADYGDLSRYDTSGELKLWQEEIDKCNNEIITYKASIRHRKDEILIAHPKIMPKETTETIQFHGTASEKGKQTTA